MTNNKVPPRSPPTEAEAKETERRLFEGLARVKMFPVDPSGPGQPPGAMLPVSNFLPKAANARKPISRMDPQARHDQALRVPEPDRIADAATLAASLKKKNGPSMEPPPAGISSPIAQGNNVHANAHDAVIMVRLMRNNPGRAFEDVEKMARGAGLLGHDPIASAMSRHPGLTSEEAADMAEDFGF